MNRLGVFLMAFALAAPLAADLDGVRAEKNLEKRAGKAMENAEKAFETAQKAYMKGSMPEADAALAELQASVELAYESLKETGKNPSRSPKHFKRAEIKTRELLRRLGDFSDQMSALDRERVEGVRKAVSRINSDLLLGIMGSKRSDLLVQK